MATQMDQFRHWCVIKPRRFWLQRLKRAVHSDYRTTLDDTTDRYGCHIVVMPNFKTTLADKN